MGNWSWFHRKFFFYLLLQCDSFWSFLSSNCQCMICGILFPKLFWQLRNLQGKSEKDIYTSWCIFQKVISKGFRLCIIYVRHWYLTGCLRKCKNVGHFAILRENKSYFYRSVNFEMFFIVSTKTPTNFFKDFCPSL